MRAPLRRFMVNSVDSYDVALAKCRWPASSPNKGNVVVFATASKYPLERLASSIGGVTLVKGEFLFAQRGADEVDVFLFPFGVGVAWGTNHLDAVVDELRGQLDALTDPWDQPLSETFSWQLGSDRDAIKGEVLHVAPHAGDAAFAIKLAFSAGLAQSIKLDSFEDEVDRLLGATEALPREIAKTGSLRMSSRDINRRIGQILQVRSDANLQYGLLDTPEFFWDLEASQNAYSSVARYLQVGRRTRVLNERLEVLKELFDLLREAKSSAYSHNLEWLIIVLITIEVAFAFRGEFRDRQ